MKSCLSYRENISAYIDDELDEVQKLSFEEHLGKCRECKRVLDEMKRIVSICSSLPQQELPAEFQAELHEKLVAVADRKASKDESIRKAKNFFLSKAFASIAASVLLIFLAGTFVRYGLFSSKMTADNAAEQAAPEMAMAKADLYSAAEAAPGDKPLDGNNTDARGTSYVDDGSAGGGMVDYNSIDSGSGTVEIDRSGTMAGRKAALSLAELPESEVVLYKTSTITITSEEPDDAAERVRLIAIGNNGEEMETVQVLQDASEDMEAFGIAASANIDLAAQPTSDGYGKTDQMRTQMHFLLPQMQYDRFISELSDTMGAANIHMGAFVSEDMTDTINSMITESEKIDSRLQGLKGDQTADTDKMAKLKQSKEEVDAQIESIRLGSDFVTVTITINQK